MQRATMKKWASSGMAVFMVSWRNTEEIETTHDETLSEWHQIPESRDLVLSNLLFFYLCRKKLSNGAVLSGVRDVKS